MKSMKDIHKGQDTGHEGQLQKSAADLIASQDVIFHVLAYMAETRENVTGNHIYRIKGYIRKLAEKLLHHPRFESYLNKENAIEVLTKSAPLHDIGSVGIPDRIFLKPGRLTPEEFEIMKSHTSNGLNFILDAERDIGIEVPFLKFAKEIVYSHHERWDGSGYPDGLAGDAIPIPARLMAVADVYDALISRRVYRQPISHDQAIKIILEDKGTQFDPDVVDSFVDIHEEFQRIAWHYADSEKDFKKKIDYLEQSITVAP
jgi:putative two-component system response regulator